MPNNEGSAGAGRDGSRLREFIAQRLKDVASFNGCIGNNGDVTCVEAAPADPTFWCKYCIQGHAAILLAVPDPLASDTGQEPGPDDDVSDRYDLGYKHGYKDGRVSASLASSSAPQGENTSEKKI